jgi:hypothetical protein
MSVFRDMIVFILIRQEFLTISSGNCRYKFISAGSSECDSKIFGVEFGGTSRFSGQQLLAT